MRGRPGAVWKGAPRLITVGGITRGQWGTKRAIVTTLLVAVPCTFAAWNTPAPTSPRQGAPAVRTVRVALTRLAPSTLVSATGEWRLEDRDNGSLLANGSPRAEWRVEREGGGEGGRRLRAVRPDGVPAASRSGAVVARVLDPSTFVIVNGKRYRGDVVVLATDSGVLAVNRLPLEEYLRGVVPLEIGKRQPSERAAIEAQAVAARSYTYTRLATRGGAGAGGVGGGGRGGGRSRDYDLTATVFDQVYGGVDAETPLTDVAVYGTGGLVLTYRGRVINAPYSSTCGGSTASASEVWRAQDLPYLLPVSDRIPGSVGERFYCDPSPRFRWSRTLARAELGDALERYLRSYAEVPYGPIGNVRTVTTDGVTPSGRTRGIVILTNRGRYTVRGNDARFVLRSPGGEILNSTYFSVNAESAADGMLQRLTVRGQGNGHGVGMCQWGAIGRARAGQDFRTILRTYFPGTTIETVD